MSLELHLVTPDREVWTGPIQMLVARGVDGELGILQGHAPLLIQLAIAPMRIQLEDGSWLAAVVDGGFLHVSTEEGATRADVLAAHAELADEIDVAAAELLKEDAEAKIAGHASGVPEEELEAARADLAKAVARIALRG